ncbi:MAG: hypothetical protein GY746_05845 [Gammaproteobacteria bacterium]|nr:hypothetical protein [Gammaproteobacteria bacterium]
MFEPDKVKLICAWLLILTVSLAMAPMSFADDQEILKYSLEMQWSRSFDAETAIGFLDPERNSIPEDLYGVAIDADGLVLVSDRITDRVILINSEGENAKIFGQSGEGPEDHRTLGEPIFLDDGNCGVFDYSFNKKLISFGADGQYREAVYMGGYDQYIRLMRCGYGYLGMAVDSQFGQKGEYYLDLFLATLSPNGAVQDTFLLGEHNLPPFDPNHRMKEEDFEIIPKLTSGPAGKVFVQRDLYRWRIECLDQHLRPIWTIEQDISARKRTPEELHLREEQMMMKFIPAKYHHVIRQMVPRDDGSLWVRSNNSKEVSGQVVFSQWSAEGQRGANIVIHGLPPVLGRFVIDGEWLLWTRHADWESEFDQYEEQPYIALYRLVLAES